MSTAYFVYMLQCADGTLYTGITNDVERRLAAHREGRGARYTRAKGVAKIVYIEKHDTKSSALKREIEIKRLKRADKLAIILGGTQSARLRKGS